MTKEEIIARLKEEIKLYKGRVEFFSVNDEDFSKDHIGICGKIFSKEYVDASLLHSKRELEYNKNLLSLVTKGKMLS